MLGATRRDHVDELAGVGDDHDVRVRIEGNARGVADIAALGDDARRTGARVDPDKPARGARRCHHASEPARQAAPPAARRSSLPRRARRAGSTTNTM